MQRLVADETENPSTRTSRVTQIRSWLEVAGEKDTERGVVCEQRLVAEETENTRVLVRRE